MENGNGEGREYSRDAILREKVRHLFEGVCNVRSIPAFWGDLFQGSPVDVIGNDAGESMLGKPVAVVDAVRTIDVVGTGGDGRPRYGYVVAGVGAPGVRNVQVLWLEEEPNFVSEAAFAHLPDRAATKDAWLEWIEVYGKDVFSLPGGFFERVHVRRGFFGGADITPQQAAAFTRLYQEMLIADVKIKAKTKDLIEFRSTVISMMSDRARGVEPRALEIHDFIVHGAIAQRGRAKGEPLKMPAFYKRPDVSMLSVAEEVAATQFGLPNSSGSYLWDMERDFDYDSARQNGANIPTAFTGHMVRQFMERDQNLMPSPEHYYAAKTDEEEVLAKRIKDELITNPPQWLVDIVWTMVEKHPNAKYNRERLARGEVAESALNVNIFADLLYSMLPSSE